MAANEETAEFDAIAYGRMVLKCEADALQALGQVLNEGFAQAVDALLTARGKIVVSGMGKSGHVGQKLAASLASTGSPAFFVHPAEAAHGDLGMIGQGDVVVMLSTSGESTELLHVANHAKRLGLVTIAITAVSASRLGRSADILLPLLDVDEACPHNIAPTTSTTMAIALGDALALTVMQRRGFQRHDFALLHPGGKIGLRLTKVRDLMLAGSDLPLVDRSADSHATIVEMTSKRLGTTGVVDEAGRLIGVITDGDLRRSFKRAPGWTAAEIMSGSPVTISGDMAADEALALMHAKSITTLFIVSDQTFDPIGIVHMHHFLSLGLR
ncbi:MAG: KpsF/GutQ family sugar-phosphate isomerase [Janthinobacterium lividum]